jgi:hypothetical protein
MKVQKLEARAEKAIGSNPCGLEPIIKALETTRLANALGDDAHVQIGHPKYQSARHSRVRIQGIQPVLRMNYILALLRELSHPFLGRKLRDQSGHKEHVRANPDHQFQ